MSKNINWNVRITWYSYDDEQIINYTEQDFEKDAKDLAEIGINIVLLGNKTHYRWNYYPYWIEINEALDKLFRAFHKYNIQVVEHHSSSLTHCPLPIEQWEKQKKEVHRTTIRAEYEPYWRKLKDFICKDSEIEGVKISSMLQIDGSTGALAISPYDTHTICYNNEDFRRIYFKYLESIYRLGPDGIMTDDIQYYNDGNSCTCPTCRKLFTEQTGYTLPETVEEWNNNFFGHYSNPKFIAFDKFRRKSAERFQLDVNKHFKSLGLNLLRPNYVSAAVIHNLTSYPFDNVAEIWDVIFQENCYSDVIKYSWAEFLCEATHRYAFADFNNVPSMSMFYNLRPDDFYFSWALSMSWGQLYNSSFDRTDEMVVCEKKFRGMEKKYPDIFYDQKKNSDFGIFFSTKTRDYIKDASTECMNAVYTWIQSATFTQKAVDFVLEKQTYDDIRKYKVIVLPHVYMMSDDEISMFGKFVENGGKLVIIGLCGKKNVDGTQRTPDELCKLFSINAKISILGIPVKASAILNGEKIGEMEYNFIFNNAKNEIAKISEGAVGISENIGNGKIEWFSSLTNLVPNHICAGAERSGGIFGKAYTQPYNVDIMRNSVGKLINHIIDKPIFELLTDDKYQITCYNSANGKNKIIHLVNIDDTLAKEANFEYSHLDIIPNFVMNSTTVEKKQGTCS